MPVTSVSTARATATPSGLFPNDGDFSSASFIQAYVNSLSRDAASTAKNVSACKTTAAFDALVPKLEARLTSLIDGHNELSGDDRHLRRACLERFRLVLRSAERKDPATLEQRTTRLFGDLKVFLERQVGKLPKAAQAEALAKVTTSLQSLAASMRTLNAGLKPRTSNEAPVAALDGGAPTTTLPALSNAPRAPNLSGEFSANAWTDVTLTLEGLAAPEPIIKLDELTAISLRASIKTLIEGLPSSNELPSVSVDGSPAILLAAARANLDPKLTALATSANELVSATARVRLASADAKDPAERRAKAALSALNDQIVSVFGSDVPQLAAFITNARGNKKPSVNIANFLALAKTTGATVKSDDFRALRDTLRKDGAANLGADDESKVTSDVGLIFESLADIESPSSVLDMNDIADEMQHAVADILSRLPTNIVDEIKDPRKKQILIDAMKEMQPKIQKMSAEADALVEAAKTADKAATTLAASKAAAKANRKNHDLGKKVDAADDAHDAAVRATKKALSVFVRDFVALLKTDAPQIANRVADATQGVEIDSRTRNFIALYGTDLVKLASAPEIAEALKVAAQQASVTKEPALLAVLVTIVAALLVLIAAGAWAAQQIGFMNSQSTVPAAVFQAAVAMYGAYWGTSFAQQQSDDHAWELFCSLTQQANDMAAKAI